MGIIYSLPGIGETFKLLQDFIRKIQTLLHMGCSDGMRIGRAIYDTYLKDSVETLHANTLGTLNSALSSALEGSMGSPTDWIVDAIRGNSKEKDVKNIAFTAFYSAIPPVKNIWLAYTASFLKKYGRDIGDASIF